MIDYIDNLLDQIKDELQSRQTNHPKVIYDKKEQKISVEYDFKFGAIPKVKLRADSKEWFDFWQEADFDRASVNFIKSHISRPRKGTKDTKGTLELLIDYADEYPDDFSFDVFQCAHYANYNNPLFKPAAKPRGGSPYGLDKPEKNKISATTAHLYVYLGRMGNAPKNSWPSYFKDFLKHYSIPEADLKKSARLKEIVREVLSKHFNYEFSDRFWRTFIYEGVVPLKGVEKLKRINPNENPILLPIFESFIPKHPKTHF